MAAHAKYGVDRPDVMITLALAGPMLLVLSLLRILPFPITYLGLALIALVAVFFVGGMQKPREAKRILDAIPWRGDERVLDVGCGRGVWLIAAAKHLTSGRAVGVDVWNRRLQSGNSRERALENAMLEGVADRVEVRNGDARALPFDNESFDVVVTSLVIHHVPKPDREKALNELVRVLKHRGCVMMRDLSPRDGLLFFVLPQMWND